ncbi:hypothetical protein DB346_23645 [Verrucomicrobia bacterium LW23]|nr:hypothetical protein DB346_23645 [Verrucomicrobia bacterium LW23]
MHIQSLSRMLIIPTLAVVLTGCGGPLVGGLSAESVAKLDKGMSPAQVRSVLGQPNEVAEAPIPIVGGKTTTYIYRDSKGATATIIFKNDEMEVKVYTAGK